MRRTFSIFLTLSGLLGLNAPTAHAFSAQFHQEITRKALTPRGWTVEAIADVNVGDLNTDDDEFYNHAGHFDSEAFEAGSARLRAKLDASVEELHKGNLREAREQFGRGFHAIQDFFAHSNFIDNHPDPKDALDPARTPLDLLNLKNPSADTPCTPPLFQGPLTTGYFPDNWKPAPHKCTHAEMNKDHDLIDAARHALNPLAQQRATIKYTHYLNTLTPRLTDAEMRQFKGLPSELPIH
jgi:hypothetical protein